MKDGWGDAGPSPARGSGGGEGPDPGEQRLLELIALGGNRGCWNWRPTTQRDTPSPIPYLGERKLLYLFCVGKSCFFTADRAPVTGSPLTLELRWKDKHSSFPEHNKVPP